MIYKNSKQYPIFICPSSITYILLLSTNTSLYAEFHLLFELDLFLLFYLRSYFKICNSVSVVKD